MSIIVGLYDDLDTVQQVVEDLRQNGFSQQNMHLATYDRRMREPGNSVFDRLSNLFGRKPEQTGTEGQDLVQQMSSWGVPEDDAQQYAEAMRRGTSLLMVNAPQDQSDRAKDIMDRYDPVDLDERVDQWRNQGWQGYDLQSRPYSEEDIDRERSQYAERRNVDRTQNVDQTANFDRTQNIESGDETHIPIVEEELRVGKRAVNRGGVRVHRTVTEEPVEQQYTVRDETVNVERRPADRAATQADMNAAFKDQTFEVTETDEELITDKQARVTGEVVVNKQVEDRPETVRDTIRRTDVQTEDLGAGQTTRGVQDFNSFNTDYRNHYDMFYGSRGGSFQDYEPAYRYGYDLAGTDRYRGKKWSDIEPTARQDWERRYPNQSWNDFRDAIRHSWERAQSGSSAADTGTGTGYVGGEGYDQGTGRYTDPNNP